MHEFLILGPLEVRAGLSAVTIRSPLERALLIRLLIDPGTVISVDRLAEDLWDGDQPASPANALRYHIWQLRSTLEPKRPRGSEGRFIRTRAPGYYFDPSEAEIDTIRFEQLAEEGHALVEDNPERAVRVLTSALELWRGEALADVSYREFARDQARRLEELRLVAAEDRIAAKLSLSATPELVPELEYLVAQHPWRERLRGLLMLALYRTGRQADALSAFRDARTLLGEELGIDPSPELRAIEKQVLLQDARLSSPIETRDSNLPEQLTSFIGRDEELDQVARLLTDHRLVTLVGPPGVGKTRLSIEAATRLARTQEQRIAWIDLVAVHDQVTLIDTLVDVLGIPQQVPREESRPVLAERESSIQDIVRRKPRLLVFDNCEHIVDLIGEMALNLLRASPASRIIATSRTPLGIGAEAVFEVKPLGLVASSDLNDRAWQRLLASESGALFVERAYATGATLSETSTAAAEIAELCRRLDGLPLALELAASRARSMSPADLLGHLDQRFLVLDPSTGNEQRGRTLWNALEWSYALLARDEAAALRCLSVFAGGFDLEAADAVIGRCVSSSQPSYNLVARLVDHSLLVPTTGEGARRFHMLESIRDFALDKLDDPGEQAEAEAALADHVGTFAEEAWEARRNPVSRAESWRRLDQMGKNISTVVNYLLASDDACGALKLAGALEGHWSSQRIFDEFSDWYRTLADACPEGDDRLIARFLYSLSDSEAIAGNPQRAADCARRAYHLAKSSGELSLAADALLRVRGWFDPWDPEFERQWQEALELYRQAGDPLGKAWAFTIRGRAETVAGDFERAREHLERATAIFEQEGDHEALGDALRQLAEITRCIGDFKSARALVERGYTLLEQQPEINEPYLSTSLDTQLAQIELDVGNPDAAVEMLSKALVEGEEQALNGHWTNSIRSLLGWAQRAAGRPTDALDSMLTALRLVLRSPWEEGKRSGLLTWVIESIAGLCVDAFDPQVGAVLFGAAQAGRQRIHSAMPAWDAPRYRRDIELLQERLAPDALDSAWHKGADMTLDAAAQMILARLSPLLAQDG